MSDHASNVQAYLAAQGVTFEATGGARIKRDDWDCFAWQTTFTRARDGKRVSQYFEYYTGIGHVKPYSPHMRGHNLPDRPTVPTAADVLYSLILDSSAIEESFANWCDEYGYDSDSIKHLTTYQACCENAKKLRQVFTREELDKLRDLTSDM